MDEPERISQLIGNIYDASLDPSLWVGVLEKTCNLIGGATAALQSHDALQHNACFYFSWNDNPEFTRSYIDTYAKLNPVIVPAMIQTKIDEVTTYLDFITADELRSTRIYREWTGPQGYFDAIQATLDRSPTSYAAVAAIYSEPHSPVSNEARQRLRLLAPHFRRAVTIGKVIDLHKVEAAALADTLDRIAAAMLLVDSVGRIIHANAAGRAMLEQGSAIRQNCRRG